MNINILIITLMFRVAKDDHRRAGRILLPHRLVFFIQSVQVNINHALDIKLTLPVILLFILPLLNLPLALSFKEIPINCSVGRLALAEATPPCIPYIGLVLQVGMTYVLQDVFCILYFVHPYSKSSPTSVSIDLHVSVFQDLTFVQIGNPDLIDGKINFAKRWQQFNILVRRRIFSTKCSIV